VDPKASPLAGDRPAFGVLCALREELGRLPERTVERHSRLGLDVLELDLDGVRVLACVGGVGKVNAARGACAMLSLGASRGLLVVGVCGGLKPHLGPGTFLHCTTAIQTDLVRVEGRQSEADAALRRAWREVAPGPEGYFLTADRPVLSWWRRARLARAFRGDCAADMETAAAGAIASAAGAPWASLRAVTDRADGLGGVLFKLHFPSQAGRAADTVPSLLARLCAEASP
jgi:adenosylhomocysteine nucleosidase